MSSLSSSWHCARCQVGVSYMPGFDAPGQPAGWEQQVDGGWLCLLCRREQVAELALAAAGVDAKHFDARAIRRRALIDFEFQRDPTQRPAAVAKVAGCLPKHAGERRRDLVAAGVLSDVPPALPKAKPTGPSKTALKRMEVDAALRASPSRSNRDLAKDLSCSASTVRLRRMALEQAGEIEHVERSGSRAAAS